MKPTNPKTKIPSAETLEINLNSSEVGFLKILQTLRDCVTKDFNFFIELNGKLVFNFNYSFMNLMPSSSSIFPRGVKSIPVEPKI